MQIKINNMHGENRIFILLISQQVKLELVIKIYYFNWSKFDYFKKYRKIIKIVEKWEGCAYQIFGLIWWLEYNICQINSLLNDYWVRPRTDNNKSINEYGAVWAYAMQLQVYDAGISHTTPSIWSCTSIWSCIRICHTTPSLCHTTPSI